MGFWFFIAVITVAVIVAMISVTMQTRRRNSTAREQMKDLFID